MLIYFGGVLLSDSVPIHLYGDSIARRFTVRLDYHSGTGRNKAIRGRGREEEEKRGRERGNKRAGELAGEGYGRQGRESEKVLEVRV